MFAEFEQNIRDLSPKTLLRNVFADSLTDRAIAAPSSVGSMSQAGGWPAVALWRRPGPSVSLHSSREQRGSTGSMTLDNVKGSDSELIGVFT